MQKTVERSWRTFYGGFEQELRGEIFLKNFVHGKRPIDDLIAGLQKHFGQIFFELRGEIDSEWVFADGSYIRAHQHASGARVGEEQAIGKFRGGSTTKIHVAADAHGNPIDFEITGGEMRHLVDLAEGSGKRTPADQRRFYAMAYGSFRECQAILELEKVKNEKLNQLQDQLGAILYTLSRKTIDRTETTTAANANAAAD